MSVSKLTHVHMIGAQVGYTIEVVLLGDPHGIAQCLGGCRHSAMHSEGSVHMDWS
jgi:hypothetical protein